MTDLEALIERLEQARQPGRSTAMRRRLLGEAADYLRGLKLADERPAPEPEDPEPDGNCERCGDAVDADGVSVEAFEMTGQLLCDSCFEAACEEGEAVTDAAGD